MSDYAEQQLKASGVAQVFVVLKQPAEADATARELGKHFTLSETTHEAALASALSFGAAGGGAPPRIKVPPPMRVYKNLGIIYGTVDAAGLSALRSNSENGEVHSAPAISLIRPYVSAAASVPRKGVTWGIKALKVDKVWAKGFTGKGVKVGHLDTGADGKHPALKQAIAAFAEFDLSGEIKNPAPAAWDSGEHGTHTAGTIAGRPVKGISVGVAPEAQLISAMVIEGGEVIKRVLGGMDWALGEGVHILSMSLGFRGYVDDFEPIVRILRQRNVLPVFAVGNEGPGTSRSPGNYAEALSVGACDKNFTIPMWSSSQRLSRAQDPIVPDLVAPGVDIASAKPGGGYQSMDGTSMATPHVAGVAALLRQAAPSATVDQIEKAIFDSCSLPASMTLDQANRGFPDAERALGLLLSTSSGAPSAPTPPAAPKKVVPPGKKKTPAAAKRKPVKKAVKRIPAKPKKSKS